MSSLLTYSLLIIKKEHIENKNTYSIPLAFLCFYQRILPIQSNLKGHILNDKIFESCLLLKCHHTTLTSLSTMLLKVNLLCHNTLFFLNNHWYSNQIENQQFCTLFNYTTAYAVNDLKPKICVSYNKVTNIKKSGNVLNCVSKKKHKTQAPA